MSSDRPPRSASGTSVDPVVHRRYLDYREKHAYFGNQLVKMISMAEFIPLDSEHLALDAEGEDGRDDEQEARYAEVAKILFRD